MPTALLVFLLLIPAIITDITQIKAWDTTISGDGCGYYAYLPCVFIYHHFDYNKIMAEEHKLRPSMSNDEVLYPFVPQYDNNNRMDKYFVGVSILLTPFFLLAYFLSYLFGYELNGYSILFQEGVALGGLFYLFIGLFYLRKLMREYLIPEKIIIFTLIVILYGTNLFNYATISTSMSHVYSFGLQALFLYCIKKSIKVPRIRNLLPASLLFGLLFIIRPTNILSITAIPFLCGDLRTVRIFLTNIFSFKKIAVILLSVFLVLNIQFIKWYIETGKWYIWGYSGEGFNFADPHFFDILFSYRKGWFVYTPLMFFILAGSVILFSYQKAIFRLIAIVVFFFITTYVCSSWGEWWYGGGFGMRVFIDYYPFYGLLLGIVIIETKNSIVRSIIFAVSVICLAISIIQTIQYNKFIFSYDKMNKTRYWDVFLKTEDKYGWMYEDPSSKLSLFSSPVFYNNFENTPDIVSNMPVHSGKHALLLIPSSGVIPLYSLKASEMPSRSGIWIYVSLWGYTKETNNDGRLITQIKSSDGKIYYTNTHNLMNDLAGPNDWERIQYIDMLSPNIQPNDSIKVSVICTKGSIYMDDISIQFGTKK